MIFKKYPKNLENKGLYMAWRGCAFRAWGSRVITILSHGLFSWLNNFDLLGLLGFDL